MNKNRNITYERLRDVLDYNPESGVFVWKNPQSNRVKAGDVVESKNSHGYIRVGIDGKRYLVHRLAWMYVYGYLPESGVDHINRNIKDNRIDNLREVSQKCNCRNSRVGSNNKLGVKGVSFNKFNSKFEVYICDNYKNVNLGLYDDFSEAVCHRLAAEQCLNWSGCEKESSAYLFVKKMVGGTF